MEVLVVSYKRKRRIRVIYRHEPYLEFLGICYLLSSLLLLSLIKTNIDLALCVSLMPIGAGWFILGLKIRSRKYLTEGIMCILASSLGMPFFVLYEHALEEPVLNLSIYYLMLTTITYVLMLSAYIAMTICLYLEMYAKPRLKLSSGIYLLEFALIFGILPYIRLLHGYTHNISIMEKALLIVLAITHVVTALILFSKKYK